MHAVGSVADLIYTSKSKSLTRVANEWPDPTDAVSRRQNSAATDQTRGTLSRFTLRHGIISKDSHDRAIIRAGILYPIENNGDIRPIITSKGIATTTYNDTSRQPERLPH